MTDFPLKVPLTTKAGDTISSVTLRRMRVKDIKAVERARIDGGDVDAGAMALAAVCDLPIEVVDEMDVEDFTMLSEKLEGFLPKPKGSPKTGK